MRLSVWTALSSSLVVIAAALIILLSANALVRERLEAGVSARLQAQLDHEIALLSSRLSNVGAAMSAVAKGPTVQAWLEADSGSSERSARWREVNAELRSVAAAHPPYAQLRLLDTEGHERVRVDRDDKRVVALPKDALQDKSKRDYTAPILALAKDEIYVSALNLNREHGFIERPLRPTLRIAAPVFDRTGRRRGAVLVNLDAETLLPPRTLGGAHLLMVDEQGVFLRHPDRAREFGLELDTGVTLNRDYGEAAAAIGQSKAGAAQLSKGLLGGDAELIAFRRIAGGPSNPAHRWRMIVVEPLALAFAPIQSLTRSLAVIVLCVTIAACAAGWLLAYRVTSPLARITRVARRITAGDLKSKADIRGGGEIEELGAAFNLMTRRLREMIADERQSSEALPRLNQDLEQTNLELTRSNQDLADFAHAASHDLRTPLRALRALPQWIEEELDGVQAPDDVRKHLEAMKGQGARMESVISGLLEYSRVGKTENRKQPFDPRAATERVLELQTIPDGFTVEIAIEPGRMMGVLPEFELMMRNLIQNAVVHHDRDHGRIAVTCAATDETLVLEVADDGPGIPPEYHERVLLPFHSLKRRDKGGGSGLGLALVNKIVQRWGGRLEILSQSGVRGTCFRLTFPLPASGSLEGEAATTSKAA